MKRQRCEIGFLVPQAVKVMDQLNFQQLTYAPSYHSTECFIINMTSVFLYRYMCVPAEVERVNYRHPPNILTMHNRLTPDNTGLSLPVNNWSFHVCLSVLHAAQ